MHEQLVKVKSEMSELKTMMLDVKEELQNLRPDTKGLQKQLEHISASDKNKYNVSERELESTNIKSHNVTAQENDFMPRTDLHTEVEIKFNMNQDINNQMLELSYEVYKYSREALFNFRDKLLYSHIVTNNG